MQFGGFRVSGFGFRVSSFGFILVILPDSEVSADEWASIMFRICPLRLRRGRKGWRDGGMDGWME
jgi:hypothetical protein